MALFSRFIAFLIVVLVVLFLIPSPFDGESVTTEESNVEELNIEKADNHFLQHHHSSRPSLDYDFGYALEALVTTYNIVDDELVFVSDEDVSSYETSRGQYTQIQRDKGKHQEVWQFFTDMIPADLRQEITNFEIIADGYGGTLAAVEQVDESLEEWRLQVDIEDSFYEGELDQSELPMTLVHEWAHVVSLNSEQIDPWKSENDCKTYYLYEGCSERGAYIDLFVSEFWNKKQLNQWQRIQGIYDDETFYNELDQFYFDYQEEFVGDYAASDPVEDFAESFSYFVFADKPDKDAVLYWHKADEKLLFFYQFPEFVELRDQVWARMGLY